MTDSLSNKAMLKKEKVICWETEKDYKALIQETLEYLPCVMQ